MSNRFAIAMVTALSLSACSAPDDNGPPSAAVELAEKLLIVDTHIDVPWRLQEKYEDVTMATEGGDFDFPRAQQGGLNVAFMSIYVPAELETAGAYELANELIDGVEAIAGSAPDRFAIATSTAEVATHFEQGLISLPLGMENGAAVEGSLDKLEHFFGRGIRYITLTHSENNHIADSSYAKEPLWNGLSIFGKELVGEMNRLGIMVDVSHVSDEAFFDVIEISQAPVLATHSSARAFTPGFERNMSDEMILALAENGGVIDINFGSSFLTETANDWYEVFAEERDAQGFEKGGDEEAAFTAAYLEQNPYPFADLGDVLDHIDHVASVAGVEHVGLGSDFDGVGNSLPTDLKDVSYYPYLVQGLIERGYTEREIGVILGGNVMRVWSAVEAVAQSMSAPGESMQEE